MAQLNTMAICYLLTAHLQCTFVAFVFVLVVLCCPNCQSKSIPLQYNRFFDVESKADQPPALSWHTTKYMEIPKNHDTVAVVVGGISLDTTRIADSIMSDEIWIYSSRLLQWTRCLLNTDQEVPEPRILHTAEPIWSDTRQLIFGGAKFIKIPSGAVTVSIISNYVWELTVDAVLSPSIEYINMCSWKNLRISGDMPEARFGHASALYDEHMYIYGGCNSLISESFEETDIVQIPSLEKCTPDNLLGDMWKFNHRNQTWSEIKLQGIQVLILLGIGFQCGATFRLPQRAFFFPRNRSTLYC